MAWEVLRSLLGYQFSPRNWAKTPWPIIVVNVVIAVDLLFLYWRLPTWRKLSESEGSLDEAFADKGFTAKVRHCVGQVGGITILCCKLARLAASLTMLILAVTFLTHDGLRAHRVLLLEALVLASIFAVANVLVPARVSKLFSPRTTLCSFLVLADYAYRDIWPLMTFTLRPKDEAQGKLLWVNIALAAWTGLLGPVLEPYPHTSISVKGSEAVSSPEQTASIFSRIFFTFLDPVIWRASRLSHLEHEHLPPMADYDEAGHLIEQSYPLLDPLSGAKKGSLLWATLKVLRISIIYQIVCILFMAVVRLASPIGVNRLLSYLESGGEDAFVRPWVWILWIALGPVTDTILKQTNLFLSTRSLVRMEAVFTTLIFDHALHLRVKSDASPSGNVTPETAASSDSSSLIGRIMNLATSDLVNISSGRDFLILCVGVPAEMAFSLWFLYVILGWSAFVGFAVMAMLSLVFKEIASLLTHAQRERMRATDSRVQLETETLSVLRMIKLLGWTSRAEEKVEEKRKQELYWIWKRLVYGFVNFNANQLIPVLCMVVTYSTYTMAMKQSLTASIVFSSITVFTNIRQLMDRASSILGPVTAAYTSLGRLQEFLWNSELLDSATQARVEDIGLEDVVFQRGGFNLIVGPTGSGKTSLLMALLGEMHRVPLALNSWVSLPRDSGIAYAAQESWVLSDTIKENILFGLPYNEERYRKVLYQCALTKDLEMFGSGDETQVGEKGITLSGGQKARVTLARAIYSSASILLLDDVLAALDVHTSRLVVERCFKGDLVTGRTVLLVTHNTTLLGSLAAFALVMGPNGEVQRKGSQAEVLRLVPELRANVAPLHESEALKLDLNAEKLGDSTVRGQHQGKLAILEEVALGRVNRKAYKLYLRSMGGALHWLSYLGTENIAQTFSILQTWWLGRWTRQYTAEYAAAGVNAPYYLAIYSAIVLVTIAFFLAQSLLDSLGRIRASRAIHHKLLSAVLGTTFRWLDVTPTSRVITRFTQDIQAVDSAVPQAINILINTFTAMMVKLIAIFVYAPVFLVPSLLVVGLGAWLGKVYIKAQLSVKRELSIRKTPVLAAFSNATRGLISIRAYSAQQQFKKQLLGRINDYTRVARTFWCLNQWIAIRLDSLSAVFAASIAWHLVYVSSISPSSVGFVLAMAVSFTDLVLGLVNWFNQLEVNANSLERLEQYVRIEQEPRDGSMPPAYWPSSGSLHVESLSASYSADGSKVLHDISFDARSGERVGIVGRTGAGKSTLTLALLRCIRTEGTVIFDGIATDTIALDVLRSNITVIPQAPELMSGTLRHNLDPFDQHDDATLNDALRSAGLFSLQRTSDENRITLDTVIAGAGLNLSVGQRQIIALARAIVRRSKLLILDEATSAIDLRTDAAIQRSLREELGGDVTVLTVAHRLQTIMDYDKIMVLDAGRIVEFDAPRALLENQDGVFRALVDASQDRETLYTAAYKQ